MELSIVSASDFFLVIGALDTSYSQPSYLQGTDPLIQSSRLGLGEE